MLIADFSSFIELLTDEKFCSLCGEKIETVVECGKCPHVKYLIILELLLL